MRFAKLADMTGGWFVGDFEPTSYQTAAAEVAYKVHPAGERWDFHYHKVATEVNCIIRGSCVINGRRFAVGDIFVIEPGEVAVPEFREACEMVVVKVPSIRGDKYVVDGPPPT